MIAVREVQPEHVDPGQEQLPQDIGGIACRSYSRDYLRVSHVMDVAQCEETAASRSIGPWIDQRFRNTHRLGVGERIVERGQWVGPAADILPGHFGGVPLEHRQRTKEVPRL